MSNPQAILDLPPGAAIAVIDGSSGRRGQGAGMVFVADGMVRLRGIPLPDAVDSWDAEAGAVRLAIESACALGLSRLRLLIDHHTVAMIVQGFRREEPDDRTMDLEDVVDAATDLGLSVSARMVQGHAETSDLPSRLNDLADILSNLGAAGGYEADFPMEEGWIDRLVARDPRFRPTRTHQRWDAFLPRRRTAHFLGVPPETVDSLVRAWHLDLAPEGVTRRSAAAIYVVLQNMRHDAYFGFGDFEGVPGQYADEIARGWDGRPSGWQHRKSGLLTPIPPSIDLSGTDEPDVEGLSAHP